MKFEPGDLITSLTMMHARLVDNRPLNHFTLGRFTVFNADTLAMIISRRRLRSDDVIELILLMRGRLYIHEISEEVMGRGTHWHGVTEIVVGVG